MTPPVTYPAALLAGIARLAEADPAREVCGLVVRHRSGRLEAVPVRNAAPPERAATTFALDPVQLLRIVRRVEEEGGAVAAIYHSHLEAPAELSAEDRRQALAGGEPLWPGVEQLVVAVRGGRAGEPRRYRFEGGRFRAAPLH